MRFKRCSIGGVEYGKVSSGSNGTGLAPPQSHSGRVTPTPAAATGASFASLSPKEQLAMTASLLPGHHASSANLLAGFEPAGLESAPRGDAVRPPNHPASIGEAAQLMDRLSSRLLEAARLFPFKSQRASMHVSSSAVTPPHDESDSNPSPFVSVAISSSSSSSSARVATPAAAPSHAWTEMAATETAAAPAARPSAGANASRHYDFDDAALIRALCDATQPAQARNILDFLLVMGVCHTAIPERDENGVVHYQAASPDEETLVIAARRLGVEFLSSSKRQARFRVFGVELVYDILNVNEFSSDRKRMSVVVRHPSGALVLYAKGADETIFPRLRAADKALAENVREHLSKFGSDGLRTLALSQSLLEPTVYHAWNERFEKAAISLEDREEKLRDLADEIETNLTLLGASAIEDRLQDGVKETIRALGDAGIKIWMLTGDKLETAINIGVSCRLLSKSMELLQLDEESLYLTSMKLASYLQTYQDSFGKTSDNLALIISGNSLLHIMNDSNMSRVFLELCRACKAVVACRLNPTQKAELVRMVKSASFQPLTLAIGDGANDVSMIQEAHIGIGTESIILATLFAV